MLLLIEPALNPVWSWLVHGERPGAWAMLGGVVGDWLEQTERNLRGASVVWLGDGRF